MDVCVFQYVHACNLIEDVLVLFSHVHIFYCVFLFMLFFLVFFLFFFKVSLLFVYSSKCLI